MSTDNNDNKKCKSNGILSLKLFPKKFNKFQFHNIKLKKNNELAFTKENIRNLIGNKISITTKNSPNSSVYITETTNNLEFSFSNNNNNNVLSNNEHSQLNNETTTFQFQNEFSLSCLEDKLNTIIHQSKQIKQTFTMHFDYIKTYLSIFEQVISILKNTFKEYHILHNISLGLNEQFNVIKNQYMKLNKKCNLQLKEIEKYYNKHNNTCYNNNKEDIQHNNSNQGINFIDNINIYEDNSFHYKESKSELDKVHIQKKRCAKSITIPKLDLSFHIDKTFTNNYQTNNNNNNNNNNKQLQCKKKCSYNNNNETNISKTKYKLHKQKSKSLNIYSYINNIKFQHK
jgi:hypothetical protein